MDIDSELKNHIITEFGTRDLSLFLFETRGVVDLIDDVISYFLKLFKKQISETEKEKKEITQVYDGEIEDINTFFNAYHIKLTTRISNSKTYRGGITPRSLKHDYDGGYYLVPTIDLVVSAQNRYGLSSVISFALAHELTHGFDILQYSIKTGEDAWYSFERNNYWTIAQNLRREQLPNNEQAIYYLLYRLNRAERNAFVAQLQQELMTMQEPVKSAQEMFEMVKKTQSYKNLQQIENNIHALNCVTDIELQNDLINYANNIYHNRFTTYRQLKKYLNRRWMNWRKAYLTKASKIAADVFWEKEGQHWMIDESDLPSLADLLEE